jgi:hypothetical protein
MNRTRWIHNFTLQRAVGFGKMTMNAILLRRVTGIFIDDLRDLV